LFGCCAWILGGGGAVDRDQIAQRTRRPVNAPVSRATRYKAEGRGFESMSGTAEIDDLMGLPFLEALERRYSD
jgi:hypothetical protein